MTVPCPACLAADYFLISDQGVSPAPKLKLTVTFLATTAGSVPLPAPAGSWTNPLTIKSLPFRSAQFNVGGRHCIAPEN